MSWKSLQSGLAADGYIADVELAMAIHFSISLKHPLLLEGAVGVGKTEDAKMQCGELLKEQGLTAGDEQDGVVNANKMYPSRGSMAVSYTHLTLPTTPYV